MFELVLDLIHRREGTRAHFHHLDHMPAELGLDRIGHFARLQLEGDVGEFRHHALPGEEAQVAALGAGVLGQFVGQLAEILARLEALFDGLGLFLGRDENMQGVDFRFRLLRLGGLVISCLHRRLGHAGLGDLAEKTLHQQLFAEIGEFLLEFGRLVELVGDGLLGDQRHVDQIIEHRLVARRIVHLLGQRRADVLARRSQIGLGDLHAVDGRQHLGLGIGRGLGGGLGGNGGLSLGRRQRRGAKREDERGATGAGEGGFEKDHL